MITVYPIDQKFQIIIGKGKGNVKIIVQPLTHAQRSMINAKSISQNQGNVFHDRTLSAFLTLKYSIKGIEGVQLPNKKKYSPDFEEEGCLTDESVETLMNSELGYNLSYFAHQAIDATPHVILNPVTGEPIDGVEFKPYTETSKKK